jgi:hypothetical protein
MGHGLQVAMTTSAERSQAMDVTDGTGATPHPGSGFGAGAVGADDAGDGMGVGSGPGEEELFEDEEEETDSPDESDVRYVDYGPQANPPQPAAQGSDPFAAAHGGGPPDDAPDLGDHDGGLHG